jgi:hypothetical protein
MSYKVTIVNELTKQFQEFLKVTGKDDRSNTGMELAAFFYWDTVEKLAEKAKEAAFTRLVKEGVVKNPKEEEEAGDFTLGESPKFVCTVNVSAKVRTFNAGTLAGNLSASKYKVPVSIALGMVEAAKVPGSARRTVKILER